MQDISVEEREKRIAATNANPWVQLLISGKWNLFMSRHFEKPEWNKISGVYTDNDEKKITLLEAFSDNDYKKWCRVLKIENDDLKEKYLPYTDFSNCLFGGQSLKFENLIFPGHTSFEGAVFEYETSFMGCRFLKIANFRNTKFCIGVDFTHAEFYNRTQFHRSVFQGSVSFKAAKFHSRQMFIKEQKSESQIRPAYVSPSFIGTKFQSTADFRDAKFETPPHFEGAECDAIFFDENTQFENDLDKGRLHLSASAWAALIRLMEKVHNLPMKHEFHNKLLEVEAQYKTEKYAKPLYAIHSWMGAGQSALLPLYGWISFNVLFFAYYSYFVPIVSKALPFTMMNAIPFITTFNRQIVENFIGSKVDVPSYIMFGAGVHTFLSGVFIFFIGLALRNRFRVK